MHDDITTAISAARTGAQLDAIARDITLAWGKGDLADDDFTRLYDPLPQRRAVAFVEQHDYLETWDVLVRWADNRVARVTGSFRDEIEALDIGQSLALSNGWAFDGRRRE